MVMEVNPIVRNSENKRAMTKFLEQCGILFFVIMLSACRRQSVFAGVPASTCQSAVEIESERLAVQLKPFGVG